MSSMPARHLTRLTVSGFQSHAQTELELTPGINIITGLEDSGKTALLRAVNWLRTNRPSGDGFKTGKDPKVNTTVTMTFADDVLVCHAKAKVSSYRMTGAEFTKCGKDVPREVTEVLALDDVNIQEQFDQPYLVWLTSGELANVFNRLSGMERFDEWQSAVAAAQRAATASIRDLRAKADRAKFELDKYNELDAVAARLAEMDALDEQIAALGSEFNAARRFKAQAQETATRIGQLEASEADVDRALALVGNVRTFDAKLADATKAHAWLADMRQRFDRVARLEQEQEAAITEYIAALKKAKVCDRCFAPIDATTIQRIKERMTHAA